MVTERDRIGAIAESLNSLRAIGEDLIVNVGSHAPTVDCRNGHASVTVRRGDDEVTYAAVHLQDAILGAHGRLNEIARLRAEKAAKDKREASDEKA